MLIRSRADFDQMLNAVATSKEIAFDTEATGLTLRHGDKTVGLSVYCDSNQQTYYFAFDHGSHTGAKENAALKLYRKYEQEAVQAENMPSAWLDDLKAVWLKPVLHIAHNAPYDLDALYLLGFPTPRRIADTMAMLSVVNTDWRGQPTEGVIPVYRMPDTGKEETGSRGLKWQARLWGLDKATDGIDGLTAAYNRLQARINEYANISVKPRKAPLKKPKTARISSTPTTAVASSIWMLRPSEVAQYAEEDTRLAYELYQRICMYGVKWNDGDTHDLYNESVLALWHMHIHGVRLDREKAAEAIRVTDEKLDTLRGEAYIQSGSMLQSINSTPQIVAYLNTLGVETTKADKAALAQYANIPAIATILKARPLAKRIDTFVRPWYKNAINGKWVLPEFNVGGTSTGRLSSSSDIFGNWQNIPRESEKVALNPKDFILPPEGCVMVEIDYAGMEMTLAAFIAETVLRLDRNMTLTTVIENGADIHWRTAEMGGVYDMILNGKTPEQWLTDNEYDLKHIADPDKYFRKEIVRQRSKTGGFAILYGGGVRGVSKGVKCSEAEAERIILGFHRAYPGMKPALDYLERLALTPRPLPNSEVLGQYISYPLPGLQLKRKYGFYPAQVRTKEGGVWSPQSKMARGAFNSLIQGTGAMIMLKSITRLFREVGFVNWHLTAGGERVYDYSSGVLHPMTTVHDSLLFAIRPQDAKIVKTVCEIMTAFPVRPMLGVEVSASEINGAWGSVKRVKDLDSWIESLSAR